MKKLSSMVTIAENNEDCVILKVKKNQFNNLVSLGCFDGDETMFRLTKGIQHCCTVWHGPDKHDSWDWGERGYTLVSEKISKVGSLIYRTISDDFGVYLGSDPVKIRQTLHKRKPAPKTEKFVAMWWSGNSGRTVHRNGEFWKGFGTETQFLEYIKSIGGEVESKSELYHSPATGCCMQDFIIKI